MKIISKYKDFYDSYGYSLGDPDESIVYVRETKNLTNRNDKKLKHIYTYLGSLTNTLSFGFGFYNKRADYLAELDTVIIGIYPYIYLCPFYVIKETNSNINPIVSEIKPITVSEHVVKKNADALYNKIEAKFNEYKRTYGVQGTLYICKIDGNAFMYSHRDIYNITVKPWKIENQNIFRTLECPTFIYSNRAQAISNLISTEVANELTLNPIFVNYPFDVLGAQRETIINGQDVYTDIENFLWETKKAPESIPDNNTKIINAGFDLKTSFRNVK